MSNSDNGDPRNRHGMTGRTSPPRTAAHIPQLEDNSDSDYDLGSDDLAGWDVKLLEKAEKDAMKAIEVQQKRQPPLKKTADPARHCSANVSTHNEELGVVAIHELLDSYTEEFTCHICQELLAAPYIANACGHTIGCGQCAQSWINKRKLYPSCSECRADLPRLNPISPNFTLQRTIEHHVELLMKHNIPGWGKLGTKRKEWKERTDQWSRDQVRKREAEAQARLPRHPYHQEENLIVALAFTP